MAQISDMQEFFDSMKAQGAKVMEVTVKKYYVTYPHEPLTEDQLKVDWFGVQHFHKSHAYRDSSHIGNADQIVEVNFL